MIYCSVCGMLIKCLHVFRSYQEWEKMAKTIKKNYPLAGAQFTKV